MRLLATMSLILGTVSVHAQYYFLNVFQKNGTKVEYMISALDSLNVTEKKPTISLNNTALSLTIGEQSQLEASVKLGSTTLDVPVSWSSDSINVATVDDKGIVTAVSVGTAIITATSEGQTATCHVSVTEPAENVHEYVDLGLRVKWATCNVGAEKPEDYGDYYAWGETYTKSTYNWSTYKYCDGSESTLTKYCNESKYGNNGFHDNKSTLEMIDDVACQKWGGGWRMPTKDEFNELLNNCTWTWTTQNGVDGYKVTSNKSGYTDRSIFLPAAGYRKNTNLGDVGSVGLYWSSSRYPSYPYYAWMLRFSNARRITDYSSRSNGIAVRPVCP